MYPFKKGGGKLGRRLNEKNYVEKEKKINSIYLII